MGPFQIVDPYSNGGTSTFFSYRVVSSGEIGLYDSVIDNSSVYEPVTFAWD
jgi:hypothetical protein